MEWPKSFCYWVDDSREKKKLSRWNKSLSAFRSNQFQIRASHKDPDSIRTLIQIEHGMELMIQNGTYVGENRKGKRKTTYWCNGM